MAYSLHGITCSSVSYLNILAKTKVIFSCKRCGSLHRLVPPMARNIVSSTALIKKMNKICDHRLIPNSSQVYHNWKRKFSGSVQVLSEHGDSIGQYSNVLNVQMLSRSLHKQIFRTTSERENPVDFEEVQKHLQKFDLWNKKASILPDVELNLPQLFGNNIDEHFRTVAVDQTQAYREHAELLSRQTLPPRPKVNVGSNNSDGENYRK